MGKSHKPVPTLLKGPKRVIAHMSRYRGDLKVAIGYLRVQLSAMLEAQGEVQAHTYI